jgi:hypothetical protein
MSKTTAALLLSAAVVLPGIANAVPEAGSPGWGQCITAINAARKAGGNQANGQNNVVPVATQVEAEKQALLQTGTCAVLPEVPLPPPPPTQ